MDRTAEYNDYVRDVCGFLSTLGVDANQIRNDNALAGSLWCHTVNGWNHNQLPAQVADDWCNKQTGKQTGKKPVATVAGVTPARRESDIPATILAYRETRRQLWQNARLTSAKHMV